MVNNNKSWTEYNDVLVREQKELSEYELSNASVVVYSKNQHNQVCHNVHNDTLGHMNTSNQVFLGLSTTPWLLSLSKVNLLIFYVLTIMHNILCSLWSLT